MASWIRASRLEPGTEASWAGLAAQGQPCGSLGRVLARVFRRPKPEILDLGPLCGESVVYLAGRGARVHVEEIAPLEPLPERRPGEPIPAVARFGLEQADSSVDLVLAWEMADFVPPERLAEFGGEIVRVLREGGLVFLLAFATKPCPEEAPPRYRILADDLLARVAGGGPPRPRFAHPNREIEKALAGLSIQGIHLQRNQLREIVALKPRSGELVQSQEQSRPAFSRSSQSRSGRK